MCIFVVIIVPADVLAINMCIFVVIIVPADALAPFGAKTSAGTVITSFGSPLYLEKFNNKSWLP